VLTFSLHCRCELIEYHPASWKTVLTVVLWLFFLSLYIFLFPFSTSFSPAFSYRSRIKSCLSRFSAHALVHIDEKRRERGKKKKFFQFLLAVLLMTVMRQRLCCWANSWLKRQRRLRLFC
jgi:hypothetical protein